ncbi:MAG: dienelactone hydrolase family protein [Nitrospirae bacterium]|nr:MAG: dienelactone hydrolase family protein [Nitrospirota bacterium]
MPERLPRFTKDQIGTSAVRFPSGVPMPSMTDAAVDPYAKTRVSKEVLVEGLLFGPQEKGPFPGMVLLHEAWGLTAQIKNLGSRLAQEGYVVLIPNLYSRQGGMVTANEEIANALAARVKETDLLQDISSCCEFLNTRDHVMRNIHGVIGFGLGGALAMRFACQRKRLRAAVAFYATPPTPPTVLNDLVCPLLYHQAGADTRVPADSAEQLRQTAKTTGKQVEIRTYAGTPHAFMNEAKPDSYRPEAANEAWEATIQFLSQHLK